jgi:DUF1365 family protein
MHSAIYQGSVKHRRFTPQGHAFNYTLFMMYLDLSELDTLFDGRWLWSSKRPALARFCRKDHLGDSQISLDQTVRDLVENRCGKRPIGPIRLLTHLRYFGYCFNPVSFYYCFDSTGEQVEYIVAEVNNTPWGEQHCYVLHEPSLLKSKTHLNYYSNKAMHVSPFMPMELIYHWHFNKPSDRLSVHMSLEDSLSENVKLFDATLNLKRLSITPVRMALVLIRFPLMTLKVIVAIHWQALRLWIKGIPFYKHPLNKSEDSTKS